MQDFTIRTFVIGSLSFPKKTYVLVDSLLSSTRTLWFAVYFFPTLFFVVVPHYYDLLIRWYNVLNNMHNRN